MNITVYLINCIEIMDQVKLEELPRYRFVAKVRKLSVKRIKLESSID